VSPAIEPSEPFGPALGRLMQERGVSYRRLAALTSLSAGYLNHVVHGNRPVPANSVIEQIATALEVDPTQFREYRLRIVSERLADLPDMIDRLYREAAG
jgi:transcriptional regulator with XRE-family HTH domain